jgi:Iron-containing redox enzyme
MVMAAPGAAWGVAGAAVLRRPPLPRSRGVLSDAVLERFGDRSATMSMPSVEADGLCDDDLHLALYCCYELHYRGFDGVDERLEWDPTLLGFRASLEHRFESALRAEVTPGGGDDVVGVLGELASAPGPSVSRHLLEAGSIDQFREFVVHRSLYQLKEADPHTWAIPRLEGPAKAAIIHVQMEEYGDGVCGEMHSQLFAETMAELGLDSGYGSYLDLVPGHTLATTNLISMFGLHRRLRGALIGQLALFEMTSVTPMGRYSAALTRLGASAAARRFYDTHVEADEDHSEVAAHAMAGRLALDDPDVADDIAFGARAASLVENRFAAALLAAWAAGRTSLRTRLP